MIASPVALNKCSNILAFPTGVLEENRAASESFQTKMRHDAAKGLQDAENAAAAVLQAEKERAAGKLKDTVEMWQQATQETVQRLKNENMNEVCYDISIGIGL